jgi:hypothetical protein
MKHPAKKGGGQQKRTEADRELDEALEDSFPASDPLPTTGVSAGAPDEREGAKSRRRRQDSGGTK